MSEISLKLCKFSSSISFKLLEFRLEKCMNFVVHFWLKSGKVRKLEAQKVREIEGTLLKKLGGNPVFLSPFRNVARMSMSTVSYLSQIDSGILCL